MNGVRQTSLDSATLDLTPAAAPPVPARRPGAWTLVKDAIFWLFLHCGFVQARDLLLGWLGRPRIVVVYYHRIGGCDVLSKTVGQFRADLAYLKRHYHCMSFGDSCRRLQTGLHSRRPIAVVTFDDGYRDNYTQAAPVLRDLGVPATFFVSTGFVGTSREFPHDLACPGTTRRYAKLTWTDLREMEAAGFEIGSHTVNHVNMGSIPLDELGHELTDSLDSLNRELGERPRPFSFPWGKPKDISPQAIDAVKAAGYIGAASAFGGANGRATSVFRVRRVDIGNGLMTSLATEARIGGLDFDYLRLKARQLLRLLSRE